jgi:hypothetical protein
MDFDESTFGSVMLVVGLLAAEQYIVVVNNFGKHLSISDGFKTFCVRLSELAFKALRDFNRSASLKKRV